jgi:ABC-type phosphate transport system auxiliary subunit
MSVIDSSRNAMAFDFNSPWIPLRLIAGVCSIVVVALIGGIVLINRRR